MSSPLLLAVFLFAAVSLFSEIFNILFVLLEAAVDEHESVMLAVSL